MTDGRGRPFDPGNPCAPGLLPRAGVGGAGVAGAVFVPVAGEALGVGVEGVIGVGLGTGAAFEPVGDAPGVGEAEG